MRSLWRCIVLATVLLANAGAGWAQAVKESYVPANGRGDPVVLVSGQTGVALYREHAARLADAGYFVVLVDGKDYLERSGAGFDPAGRLRLRALIDETVNDPRSTQSRAALVGFSLGGGAVVQWALADSERVSRAVLFYPMISRPGQDMARAAADLRYPVLLLTGARDTFNNCCLVETMEQFRAEAQRRGAPLELVVYPEAQHGFNLRVPFFREADAADAWKRLIEFLSRR